MIRKYTKEEYIELIGRALEGALPPNSLIIFFGSILTDRFSRTSDVDVAVYSPGLSDYEFLKLYDAVEELPILREVDIVNLETVRNPELLRKVLEEGLFWKRDEKLVRGLGERLKNLER